MFWSSMTEKKPELLPDFDGLSLSEIYRATKRLELLYWGKMCDAQRAITSRLVLKELPNGALVVNATAEFADDALRIVVDSSLPHQALAREEEVGDLLERYWLFGIADAVRRVCDQSAENIRFDPAVCQIVNCMPAAGVGTVDHRAIKSIFLALTGCGVIAWNGWDKLAYVLIHRVDEDRPRTEISVFHAEQNQEKVLVW